MEHRTQQFKSLNSQSQLRPLGATTRMKGTGTMVPVSASNQTLAAKHKGRADSVSRTWKERNSRGPEGSCVWDELLYSKEPEIEGQSPY